MAVKSVALSALLAAVASAQRVALYRGTGSSAGSSGNFSAAFKQLVSDGSIASVKELDETGITAAQLTLANFDVVVFPGGGGSAEAGAIGPDGAKAVQAFVTSGGGYYGTCAGGFLALSHTCCDVAVPGYCGGKVGCSASSYGLALIDLAAAEPWDRGHGYVTMMLSDAAIATFQLNASRYSGKNVSILYWQGPIADKKYVPTTPYATHGVFTTEIHSGHTQYTTGQMVGAPSLMTTTYGSGRVLISPPHPEETQPQIYDLIRQYTLWASKKI